jgi:hypothetical protein
MLRSSSWAISSVDSRLLRPLNFASLSANSSIDRYHKETADACYLSPSADLLVVG